MTKQSQQEMLISCTECDNTSLKGRYDPKCYVNLDKNTWHCFRCHASGKAEDLKLEELNIVSITTKKPLNISKLDEFKPKEESRNYLRTRFPEDNVEDLEKSYGFAYNEELKALAIPVYDLEKNLTGIKYRILNPTPEQPKYLSEPGSKINGFWLNGSNKRKLLVVEGEFDAITAQLAGFSGDVVALQTNKPSGDLLNTIRTYNNIFLCLDNDDAGREGEQAFNEAHINYTSIQLKSEMKDLSDIYRLNGKAILSSWLKEVTQTELERETVDIQKIWDLMLEFMSNREKTKGISTGFSNLDLALGGGLRPSEMTVVNSFAKIGKSTFVNNIVHNVAQQGRNVLVVSFEMTPENHFFPTLLSIAGELNLRTIPYSEVRQVSEYILTTKEYLKQIKILKKFGQCLWDKIEEWVRANFEAAHYDLVILDHVGFMVKDMTDASMNQTLAQSIAKLCRELETHIISVVQSPYPVQMPKEGSGIRPYGGAAWIQNPDNYIQLERSKDHEDALNVYIKHVRYPFNNASDSARLLLYDRDTCKLKA